MKKPQAESLTYRVAVQRDEDGRIDTIVLDFGKTKRNQIFLSLEQAEWFRDIIEDALVRARKNES